MQFYIISVSFFMFLLCIIEENAPRGGVLARFYRPGGGGLKFLLPRGEGGDSPTKKLPGGDGKAWN